MVAYTPEKNRECIPHYPESILKHRGPFLSRFLSSNHTISTATTTIPEKQPIQTPYVPAYAASSFLLSTTPVTLDERYQQKQLQRLSEGKSEDLMTISQRAEAMRQRGRERGEIKLEIIAS